MYKYLFFDADGTLFNFKKSEKIALENAIRQEAGIWRDEFFPAYHEINDQLWKKAERKEITLEKLRPERFEILKKRFGLEYDSNRMSDAYIDCLSKSTDMLPGAIEILEKYSRTHTLVLMTNGLSKVQRGRLHGTDTAKYFKLVVISEEIKMQKPDARYFQYAFDALGNPPLEEILMIGDSLTSDIQGARNAHIDSCLIAPCGVGADITPRPDYIISKIGELKEIV